MSSTINKHFLGELEIDTVNFLSEYLVQKDFTVSNLWNWIGW